jgi:23S rRNA (guanine745-N1)-methyltransferase
LTTPTQAGSLPYMLLCAVRDCHLPLASEERRLTCPRGHSFDVARSGYVNLLQPQDRRSRDPGDTRAAIAARRRLHDRGVTRPLLEAIAGVVVAAPADVILDAGCGEGFYLGSLVQQTGAEGYGIDISIPAIDAAARRYPESHWIVANADRFVPLAEGSASVALSITGRRNPAEFRRVLRADGRALIAVPSPEDLIELRGPGRDRVEQAVAEFEGAFTLAARSRITTVADLDAAGVEDVLHSIYRPMQPRVAEAMSLTFSLDVLLFRVSG